jgi:alcohol dehydrogenase
VPGFTCDGAFAELITVAHADTNLTCLPKNLPADVAAALGCRVTTAWQALVGRAMIRPREWLAVFGTGGVGLATLLLGRALGARVVAVDIAQDKLDYARKLGADAVLNATQVDAPQAVHEITRGGAHVAIEALGIQATTEAAMRSLRKLGRMVQIGMPAGDHARMTLPMDLLYSGQLSMHGTRGMPSWRYPDLLNLIAGGHVDLAPMVTRHVSLS